MIAYHLFMLKLQINVNILHCGQISATRKDKNSGPVTGFEQITYFVGPLL